MTRSARPARKRSSRLPVRARTRSASCCQSGAGTVELTARERQVLGLTGEGLTNRQIGERLFISGKTASVHVSAIRPPEAV